MINYLAASPALQVAATVLFGLAVGSFLNVVIHRLPRRMEAEWRSQCAELLDVEGVSDETAQSSIVWPPSGCPSCGTRLGAIENIPLLSYLVLGGRCRHCREPISARYPLIELATAILFAVVVLKLGWTPAAMAGIALTGLLIALTGIDLEHMLLPDDLTLALLWLGLVVAVAGIGPSPSDAIIGACAGYLSLWGVYHLFRLLTGKEGMGYGDFKLLAALGAWLGWGQLPVVILLAAGVGSVVGLTMIALMGHERGQAIPFGPYLAAAGWISFLWGDQLMSAYLAFSGVQG